LGVAVAQDSSRPDTPAPIDVVELSPSPAPSGNRRARALTVALVVAVCGALVAIPLSDHHHTQAPHRTTAAHRKPPTHHEVRTVTPHHTLNPTVVNAVFGALTKTAASGSLYTSFDISEQPSPNPPKPTCDTEQITGANGSGSILRGSSPVHGPPVTVQSHSITVCHQAQTQGPHVTGHGIINTAPAASTNESIVPGLGAVSTRNDGTHLWETGGANYGLEPNGNEGASNSLSGFANLVEATLGPREGSSAMRGLGSPLGYLELDRRNVTDGSYIGTGTVGGVPVRLYSITLDIMDYSTIPGSTAEQTKTITDSLAVAREQHYTSSTIVLAIDGNGFVRQSQGTDHYADGGTATVDATFSGYGCAGRIVMPGAATPPTTTPPTTTPSGCATPPAPVPLPTTKR
jgi:hypothetical protein